MVTTSVLTRHSQRNGIDRVRIVADNLTALLTTFVTAASLLGWLAVATPAAERPNFIFILADDLGWGDPPCYNPDSRIPMPHLDRLAAEGMRFTDAHSPSSVCTPTRYGILTGRYAWRSRLAEGVLHGYSPALIEPGLLTVPKLLQAHGYHTACIGKWHLGLGDGEKTDYARPLRPGPLEAGFDEFFGIPASLDMDPYLFIRDDRPTGPLTGTIAQSLHRRQNGGGFWRGGAIQADFRHVDVLPRITDEAIGYIRRRATANGKQRQPFFLYFPLTAPHTPWMPIDEYTGRSEVGYYGDFVTQVDATIGRVIAALDQHDLADDTLLVVTSDNGSHWPIEDVEKWRHRANGPWRGQKADIHEGGHRVPFVVRWPGRVTGGLASDETICLTDWMATCAAIIGADLPSGAAPDSYDISRALVAPAADPTQPTRPPIREAIVHHSSSGMFAIRQGEWKLIVGLGSGGFTSPRVVEPADNEPQGQLYNLAADPAEEKNLYHERPGIVERLNQLLEDYRNSAASRPADL
jgi:arylsulfatase A-like enzyme